MHQHLILAAFDPFNGVVPNADIFGANFTTWWQKLLAGVWAVGLIVCAFKLFPAMASLHAAKRAGMEGGVMTASQDVKLWAFSLGGTIGAGLIFGAALAIFGG